MSQLTANIARTLLPVNIKTLHNLPDLLRPFLLLLLAVLRARSDICNCISVMYLIKKYSPGCHVRYIDPKWIDVFQAVLLRDIFVA